MSAKQNVIRKLSALGFRLFGGGQSQSVKEIFDSVLEAYPSINTYENANDIRKVIYTHIANIVTYHQEMHKLGNKKIAATKALLTLLKEVTANERIK